MEEIDYDFVGKKSSQKSERSKSPVELDKDNQNQGMGLDLIENEFNDGAKVTNEVLIDLEPSVDNLNSYESNNYEYPLKNRTSLNQNINNQNSNTKKDSLNNNFNRVINEEQPKKQSLKNNFNRFKDEEEPSIYKKQSIENTTLDFRPTLLENQQIIINSIRENDPNDSEDEVNLAQENNQSKEEKINKKVNEYYMNYDNEKDSKDCEK